MINSFNKFRDMLILEACLSAHEDLLDRLSKIAKGSDRSSEIAITTDVERNKKKKK